MNINSVYECSVYQITAIYYIGRGKELSLSQFVKKAIVYRDKKRTNHFIDLNTKEVYDCGKIFAKI